MSFALRALLVAGTVAFATSASAQSTTTCNTVGRSSYCTTYDPQPANPALQNGMANFGAALGERIREHHERKVAEEQARQQDITAMVTAFAMDPAHPYFGMLRPQIAKIITSRRADSLQQAYDLAVSESPAVQAAIAAQTSK